MPPTDSWHEPESMPEVDLKTEVGSKMLHVTSRTSGDPAIQLSQSGRPISDEVKGKKDMILALRHNEVVLT